MTPLESFLFLASTVGFLWVMWLLLDLVFDLLEQWHDSRRNQPSAEDGGKPTRGKVS